MTPPHPAGCVCAVQVRCVLTKGLHTGLPPLPAPLSLHLTIAVGIRHPSEVTQCDRSIPSGPPDSSAPDTHATKVRCALPMYPSCALTSRSNRSIPFTSCSPCTNCLGPHAWRSVADPCMTPPHPAGCVCAVQVTRDMHQGGNTSIPHNRAP